MNSTKKFRSLFRSWPPRLVQPSEFDHISCVLEIVIRMVFVLERRSFHKPSTIATRAGLRVLHVDCFRPYVTFFDVFHG